MIATVSQLRKEIEFNNGLHDLLGALKTVAVSQYRILEKKLESGKALYDLLQDFFTALGVTGGKHPFLESGNKTQLIVIVTTDMGLLGGLNMQVLNAAFAEAQNQTTRFIVMGERGQAYFRERGIAFTGFEGVRDDAKRKQATRLKDHVIGEILKGKVGALKVVYPRPITFTVQRVEVLRMIPYAFEAVPSDQKKEQGLVLWESHPLRLAEYLISIWIEQKLFDIFGQSRLSELAARFTHLEDSSRKLEVEQEKLRLQYFRIRHELVDRSMRDLFTARMLFAKQKA